MTTADQAPRPGTPQAHGVAFATVQQASRQRADLAAKAAAPYDLSRLPPLLAELRANFEKRLRTPTSVALKVDLPPCDYVHDEAAAIESDRAYENWKAAGGPARDNERRALDLQMRHQDATGRPL